MMRTIQSMLIALTIPVAFAMLYRMVFDHGFADIMPFALMSVSFLGGVPFCVGYLTVLLSDIENVRNTKYCAFAPWVPVVVFMLCTLVAKWEGAACWIMILPIWLVVSMIGGFFAGRRRRRKQDNSQKLQDGWVLFMPLLFSPVEKAFTYLPARYEAYTYTDITAPPEKIWSNVVRVRTIEEGEDQGYLTRFLGFPRPIRAELNYAGVGGSRQAIFSKGLVFTEVVQEYEEQRKMRFTIKADARSIPPTTMDEHIVIGGEYFDVLDGTYRLEELSEGRYRLHLYSHFVLKTSFNWYASWWAGWIMRDIQNNILQVIQTRCREKL